MTYPAIIDTGAYLDYQTNANNYADSCDAAPLIHHASVQSDRVLPGRGLRLITFGNPVS
jgi:hypothetical protein